MLFSLAIGNSFYQSEIDAKSEFKKKMVSCGRNTYILAIISYFTRLTKLTN